MPSMPSESSCVSGKAPRRHQRRGDRELRIFGEFESLGRSGADDAAAGVKDRTLRPVDRLYGGRDLFDMALDRGPVAGQVESSGVVVVDLGSATSRGCR